MLEERNSIQEAEVWPKFSEHREKKGSSPVYGTYRRVAASVEVSSPSILYTFPYMTYSNWSALWNNSGKVIPHSN